MAPHEIPMDLPETEWTEISIEREVRVGKPQILKIKVPFTAIEVDEIKNARDAIESLKDEAMRGSTIVREIYGEHPVPWGGGLINRGEAIQRLRDADAFITQKLASHGHTISDDHRGTIERAQTYIHKFFGQV